MRSILFCVNVLTLASVAEEARSGTEVVVEMKEFEPNDKFAGTLEVEDADDISFSGRVIVGASLVEAPAAAII